MESPDRGQRPQPRIPARQPRRRHPRRHGLRRHARRLPRRARREVRTERWTTQVGDNPTGHAITAAPLAVDGKIIVGISGGEAGIRGFLDAYDAKTGKQVWRFWTVPSPGEPGQRNVARRQLDARRRRDLADRLVRSRAEAALLGHRQSRSRLERRLAQRRQPLHVLARRHRRRRPAKRAGIFSSRRTTCTTGTRTRFPCSSTPTVRGTPRKLVVMANRNGFYYVLDRETGEYPARRRRTRSRRGPRDSTRRGGRS